MLFDEYKIIQKDGMYHVVEQKRPGKSIAIEETRCAAFLSGHKYLKLMNRFKRLMNMNVNEFIIYN